MILPRKFLKKDPEIKKISKIQTYLGIFVGLFFSFLCYAFMYLVRETFRLLSVTGNNEMWLLSDQEVNFYNLIYAFIAVIFGQSITFKFWLAGPKKLYEKQFYNKITIINDQRFLNWFFISWFAELAVVFGFFYVLCLEGSYYIFSFYPTYNFLFILIIIVLFLQTWATIRRVYKQNSLKWMLASSLILSVLAFGISKINLVDYKTINANYLQRNIHYNHLLEFPASAVYNEWRAARSISVDIYLAELKKKQIDDESILIIHNKAIGLADLALEIEKFQAKVPKKRHQDMVYYLNIHKGTNMEYVNLLRNELTKHGVFKIAYSVVPTNPEFDLRYYKEYSFPMRLPDWENGPETRKGAYISLNKISNVIEVKYSTTGYLINNEIIEKSQLKTVFKNLILKNPDYAIKYHVNEGLDFSKYFWVLSSAKEAVDELRNDYALSKYDKTYDRLTKEKKREVRHQFYFYIFEITPKVMKLIEAK